MLLVIGSLLLGVAVGWWAPDLSQRICGLELKVGRPLAAAAGGIVLAVISWGVGWGWSWPAFIYVGAAGTLMLLIDVEHHRLPDKLTLPSYPVVAILLLLPAIANGQWGEYGRAILGCVAMFVFYFLLALIYPAGMGMGDVKLAGVVGLALGFAGWAFVVIGLLAAFFLGAVIGIGLMIGGKAGRKTAVPFGPFMIAGTIVGLVFAQDLVSWYVCMGGFEPCSVG